MNNYQIEEVTTEVRGRTGFITLNRPRALNALSLQMVRAISEALLAWRHDPKVLAVAIRGNGKEGPFGAFCAGGDIRFLHASAMGGNPEMEDFFTEEYALNYLIHTYGKPYIAFMDGIVMGGGMGISQGASLRVVTPRTKMAMPETNIGFFPDVGGGYFLSRCPGSAGEYLALTGEVIGAEDAMRFGLADAQCNADALPALWDGLASDKFNTSDDVNAWLTQQVARATATASTADIDRHFGKATVPEIIASLEAASDEWTQKTAATLRQRSPLMLYVVLEQIRRARAMTLAQDLQMERDLVRHCFHLRPGAASESVEGIRALAVDKDHSPKWNPACIEDVTPEMVAPYFDSPWPASAHPLRSLA